MILDLHRQGLSLSAIARRTGLDRKTVRRCIARGLEAPVYSPRPPREPVIAPWQDHLRQRVQAVPELTAKRLLREIRDLGTTGGYTAVKTYVRGVMVMDQAGWHGAKALVVPDNVTLVPLPPYSPELNPVERVWLFLRERFLSFRVFPDQNAIVEACCHAWNALIDEPGLFAPSAFRARPESPENLNIVWVVPRTACRMRCLSGLSGQTLRPGSRRSLRERGGIRPLSVGA